MLIVGVVVLPGSSSNSFQVLGAIEMGIVTVPKLDIEVLEPDAQV